MRVFDEDIGFFDQIVELSLEVLDDISAYLLPTWLVNVAALLRRYSPSPYPLLRLLSYVSALASSN
jgi:hypothetical protein